MNLSRKLLIIVFIVISIVCFLNYLFLSSLILTEFKTLESKNVDKNLALANNAISTELNSISFVLTDYAEWNETYSYMQGINPDYPGSELTEDILAGIEMNFVALVANSGSLDYVKGYDLEDEEKEVVPWELMLAVSESPILMLNESAPTLRGIFVSNQSYWLIGATPILTTESKGPIMGTMVMGRKLNSAMIDKISTNSGLEIDILNNYRFNLDAEKYGIERGQNVVEVDETQIVAYKALYDIYGNQLLTLKLTQDRFVWKEAKHATKLMAVAIIVSAPLLTFIVYFIINRLIVDRIVRLSRRVLQIGKSGGLKTRLKIYGNDEISNLTRTINKTINELRKLEEERTSFLQKSNKRLRELDKSKSEFLNLISHELKTPLTPILANTSIVSEEDLGKLKPIQKQKLQIVLRNGERLKKIIANLLEISRIEAGKLKLDYEIINLNDIAKEVAEDTEVAAKGMKIQLKFDLAKTGTIRADRERIKECLSNLVNNSIKFTEKGSITIFTKKKNRGIVMGVRDTGIGIEKDQLKQLFNKFYQLGETEVGKKRGVGLGLYSVKKIIEVHKGKVGVKSKRNQGSEFWFWLPKNNGGKK